MIYELLPTTIKISYLKIKTASNLQSAFDALRELLDELELNSETKGSYGILRSKLDKQETVWNEQFKFLNQWISSKLKFYLTENYTGEKTVKKYIKKIQAEIKQGTPSIFQGRNYIEMMLKLFDDSTSMIARYGNFEFLKNLGKVEENVEVLRFSKDPFAETILDLVIYPETDNGKTFEESLRYGFIKVDVQPPHEFCDERQYSVVSGKIKVDYPLELEEYRNRVYGRTSPDVRENRPALLLIELLTHAYWRDYVNADNRFSENFSEKDLNDFYSTMSIKGQLHLTFALKGIPEEVKTDLFKTLDRFLLFVIQEEHQSHFENKERAFNYAYSKIKQWLMLKSLDQRNACLYPEITKQILNDAELEMLPYPVCKEHCIKACKHFAKEYGWIPKRRSFQSKRVSPSKW